MIQGIGFVLANILASAINFYLGSGGLVSVERLRDSNNLIWAIIFVPHRFLTEMMPAMLFALTVCKYNEIFG